MFARRENSKLTLEERGAIIALHNNGVSVDAIARDHIFCNRKSVLLWIQRYEENGNVYRKQGSGRPRITTSLEDETIMDSVRAKPITTLAEIAGIK